MNFRRTFLISFCCLSLAAVAAVFLEHMAGQVAAEGGSQTTGWMSPAMFRLFRQSAIAVIAISALLILYRATWLNAQMSKDLDRLRSSIGRLANPTDGPLVETFTYDEFQDCALELRKVAKTIREQQDRLSEDAALDALTGLPNRRTFEATLRREAAHAVRTGWPLSLVMVDLDHFKKFNDTHGHQAGDFVLQRSARRLSSLVRQSDVVARYGGEEFVAILPSTRLEQAMQVAQELRNALRCDEFIFGDQELHVTASFGVAELHECGLSDIDALVSHADVALYEAKRQGRDTVVAAPKKSAVSDVARELRAVSHEEEPHDTVAVRPDDAVFDRETMALMGSTFTILQVIPDLHRVAHDVIEQVAAVIDCATVSLYTLRDAESEASEEAENGLIRLAHLGGSAARRFEDPALLEDLRSWLEELSTRTDLARRRHIEPTILARKGESGERQVIRLPLVAYGTVVGAIQAVSNEAKFDLNARQEMMFAALSAIGATALRICDVYNRSDEGWMALIEALCSTIHSQDAYKRDHAMKVSEIAVALARAMGQQNTEELQLVRVAGFVKDIGNLGLPTKLFNKRRKLSARERRQLEEHCRLGADILREVAQLDRLSEIVLHHHEHYDGGGYPEHLAGNEIPIESRILAVADAYAAMRSKRPFRQPLTHEEAVNKIRAAHGTQFDPAVVTVFLECFSQSAPDYLFRTSQPGQMADAEEHDAAEKTQDAASETKS